MVNTESAAREKWCPFVRLEGNNRFFTTESEQSVYQAHRCIASQCMAWRELHLSHFKGGSTGGEQHGYCGLAGRPDLEQGW